MAQNDPQKMEAAGPRGDEQSRAQAAGSTTAGTTATQGSGTTGREQQAQSGGRVTRREGWEDQAAPLFGSPFALFRRLSDDMDRLFFGGGQGVASFGGVGARFMPTVDVEEREDKILVRADLPGVNPDDFRVDIEDDSLVLQGERRNVREETRGGIRRSERSYGSFRRVIPLPPGANLEAADASFENGVLEIEIPVQQQSKARRLEIHTGSKSKDPTRH
jgi:HSP20 family protein